MQTRLNDTPGQILTGLRENVTITRRLTLAGVAELLPTADYLSIHGKLASSAAGGALLDVIRANPLGADWGHEKLRSALDLAFTQGVLSSTEVATLKALGEIPRWQQLGCAAEPTIDELARLQALIRCHNKLTADLTAVNAAYNDSATAGELLALVGLE